MGDLEKFLNSSLIDTLCEAREEEFENLYINGKDEIINNDDTDAEQELLNEIKKYVSNDEERQSIRIKVTEYERCLYKDFDSILKKIYRLGVVDGYKLKKELKDMIDDNNC
jgi:biopolymer transport protein ExbD